MRSSRKGDAGDADGASGAGDGDGVGPVVRLDEASPEPKYQQIIGQIRAFVASGALPAGAPLPSVRQLAADLGINVNTVIAAYRALEAENIVLLRRGSRAMVHPRLAQLPALTQAPTSPDEVAALRAMLERVRTEATLHGVSLEELRALAAEVFG